VTGLQWHGDEHFLDDFPASASAVLLPPNLATLAGVRDAAAYNPLLLHRAVTYFDRVTLGQRDDHWLWLDDFQSPPASALGLSGVLTAGSEWRVADTRLSQPVRLPPGGEQRIWSGSPVTAKRLRVISYLGEATQLEQGAPAIELRLRGSAGDQQAVTLRAGLETAEWAYGRRDVRTAVRHRQAPIALETRLQGAVEGRFAVFQYAALVDVTLTTPVVEIDGRSLAPGVTAVVDGIYLEPPTPPTDTALPDGAELVSVPQHKPRARLSSGSATIVVDEPERIVVRTTAAGADRLVLADAFYPGWQATVDERPASAEPEDELFRAVAVPAGSHEVEFRYRPKSLVWGALLSGFGGLLCVALFVRGRRRQPGGAEHRPSAQ
jgi:hypothetical protein